MPGDGSDKLQFFLATVGRDELFAQFRARREGLWSNDCTSLRLRVQGAHRLLAEDVELLAQGNLTRCADEARRVILLLLR